MSKRVNKMLNSKMIISDHIPFGAGGRLYIYEKYFMTFNENDLSTCWVAVSDNFSKYLVLSGKCELNIICGALEINGVIFNAPLKQNVYSPISHAKVTFRIKNSNRRVSFNFEKLMSTFIEINNDNNSDFVSLKNLLINNEPQFVDENWNLFKLTNFSNQTIEDITQFKEFRNLFAVDINFPFAAKLRFSLTLSDHPEYYVTDEMKTSLDAIIKSSSNPADIKVAIIGPQNSGKSSFLKTLTNEMFSKGHKEVCIIDGDPGQCEFSTCGSLSLTIVSKPLFGPPFTHIFSNVFEIKEQHFLGLLSPNDDPNLYCRSFEQLYHKYLSICSEKPLIINTMGWLSGVGLSLLAFKLLLVNPSHILQLKKGKKKQDRVDISLELIKNTIERFDRFVNLKREITSEIFYLKSPVSQIQESRPTMKPDNHRDLSVLAYLYHQTEHHPKYSRDLFSKEYNNNPVTRLLCRVPVVLKYIHQSENFASNNSDGIASVKLELAYSEMNDNINQLDCIEDRFIKQLVRICRPTKPCYYKSVVNKIKYEKEIMVCIGMGLVIRVRKNNNEIDLLTEFDKSVLNGCTLVKGKFSPPEMLSF